MSDRPPLIRADLHNHTHHSPDSILTPEHLLTAARKRGLNVVAVTEHNTIRGALAVRELAERAAPEIRIIVGEEVRTRDGEVLGIFLTDEVPRGLSAAETIDRIKSQGGIAGAPHPYDSFRSGLREDALEAVAERLDFVEGLNARMVLSMHNDKAVKFAAGRGLPLSAASDAHSRWEIGRAYVEMPDFSTAEEFLPSLRAGKLVGRLSSPFIHMISRYATIRSKLGWKPR